MQAIVLERFGDPGELTLRELPDAEPGPGEVALRVDAVDVLHLDVMIRAGDAAPALTPELPYTPGGGVAGEIVAVGAGVDRTWTGRRVTAETGPAGGGYADRLVVPMDTVCPIPDGLPSETAAALLHDGVTGVGLADATDLGAGQRVLILGGSGGLGIVSAQLAAARSARAVAVARGRRKLNRLRALGVAVVDGTDPDWVRSARAALGGLADIVLDNVGGALGKAAFDGVLADGGRFSAHGTPSGTFAGVDVDEAARRRITLTGVEAVYFGREERTARTAQAFRAAVAGVLAPVIGQRFELADAAGAHAAIEARTVFGKTLLVPA